MTEYPQSHPKYTELKALKEEIDDHYVMVKSFQDSGREQYTIAMDALKKMGGFLKDSDNQRTLLVEKLQKLEELAASPLV